MSGKTTYTYVYVQMFMHVDLAPGIVPLRIVHANKITFENAFIRSNLPLNALQIFFIMVLLW